MKKSDRAPMKRAQKIGSVIKELFAKPGFGEQLSRHQAWLIWDQIVGSQIASRARPKKLRKGVLEIQVDHPVWMQQLHMLKPAILEKINARIPEAGITDIYLRQAKQLDTQEHDKRREAEPLPWEKTSLSKQEQQEIEEQLDGLDDAQLKESFRKLLTLQKRVDKNRAS